jgi:glucoamylase
MNWENVPPGAPGISPTWSSSDKDFVTSALGSSRLWVTIGHGVLNEVYWPSTGEPRLRDLTFYLVGKDAQGQARWIDLKRVRAYRLSTYRDAIPLLTVTHHGDDYELELEVVPDSDRDCVMIRYAIKGDYRLVVIVAPHLDGDGTSGTAWVDADLFAEGRHCKAALCLSSQDGFVDQSAGFAGHSDGWQDLAQHGRLTWHYPRADNGNVVLSAGLAGAEGVLSLAISDDAPGARTLARSSLADGFDTVRARFIETWERWCKQFDIAEVIRKAKTRSGQRPPKEIGKEFMKEATLSATILKIHEDRNFPGALVASLSVPWGSSTNNLGGYHLVWPRDTVMTAFAFIAIDHLNEASKILSHLVAAQQPDGHWTQNYYPSGIPYWTGIQLDEAALPILLAAKLKELGVAEPVGVPSMVRRAVAFIARNGPSSQQGRWEENPGINPYTLATLVAALIAAAPWLDKEETAEAQDIADEWNDRLDEWCVVTSSRWTKEVGVPDHFIRIRPTYEMPGAPDEVNLQNRNGERIAASNLVAFEFSYLTRLGLRAPDDPVIANTIRVVDHALGVETPSGIVFHRYNEDGYGEHEDGSAFDGSGIGRLWPFLAGERGHLAVDRGEDARPWLKTMVACSSAGGLMPEQVWDRAPIKGRRLYPGRPSGSAMPLLWTHAEFLKLLMTNHTGKPVERLASVEKRYGAARPKPKLVRWSSKVRCDSVPDGCGFEIQDDQPFDLHYGFDGWKGVKDRAAAQNVFGQWCVRLEPKELAGHSALNFTRRWGDAWEGVDHAIVLAEPKPATAPRRKVAAKGAAKPAAKKGRKTAKT